MLFVASALIATATSMIGLSLLAKKAFDAGTPRTLSEMASTSSSRMVAFRAILIPCSALFLMTLVRFVAPASQTPNAIIVAALVMCLSEMVLAVVKAHAGLTGLIHNGLGYLMGSAMYALVVLFWAMLSGGARLAELCIAVAMVLLFIGMLLNKPRFLFYELSYIYLSHVSIVLVAIALVLR